MGCIVYFDCFAGASGDMIVGALLDTGKLTLDELSRELAKLPLTGYELRVEKVSRGGIVGTGFRVEVKESPGKERSLRDILALIGKSSLPEGLTTKAGEIFRRLAEAEGKMHGKSPDDIHFHEVGAVDSIVDIVGSLIALARVGAQEVYASPLAVGRGYVKCAHGRLPVPAPATLELLAGFPLRPGGLVGEDAELVTPTGAVLLSVLATPSESIPPLQVEGVGYGAGSRDLRSLPNLLRVIVGKGEAGHQTDTVSVLETNIDDLNPQVYAYLEEKLFQAGARDIFLIPVHMKKNRPGVVLTVLAEPGKESEIAEIIFRETGTLGIRLRSSQRKILARESIPVKLSYGEAQVKLGRLGEDVVTVRAEYDTCRELARKSGRPLREVLREAEQEAWKILGGRKKKGRKR